MTPCSPPPAPSDSPIGYLEVRVHSAESYLVNTSQSSFQSASGVYGCVWVCVGVSVFPADLQLALFDNRSVYNLTAKKVSLLIQSTGDLKGSILCVWGGGGGRGERETERETDKRSVYMCFQL